jgi:glycosyltransferase involved in cell wall biosynthesis
LYYSLIIPAWNEAELLPGTLASIGEAMQEVDRLGVHHGELIVVDNNSTDDTADIAKAAGATVVFEPINQIAKARNRGASVASGNAFVFVDADSVCSAALLSHALGRLATDQVAGGGSIIAPDQAVKGAALNALRFWNWLSRKASMAAGCFIFCRRDAFEAVNGFNEKVYAGEEIYLSRKLKRWSRRRGMNFEILDVSPVITSVRKLQWYGSVQLTAQALLVMIPGAIYSRHLCRTWYDKSRR